jgi:hypothetical protein
MEFKRAADTLQEMLEHFTPDDDTMTTTRIIEEPDYNHSCP